MPNLAAGCEGCKSENRANLKRGCEDRIPPLMGMEVTRGAGSDEPVGGSF